MILVSLLQSVVQGGLQLQAGALCPLPPLLLLQALATTSQSTLDSRCEA